MKKSILLLAAVVLAGCSSPRMNSCPSHGACRSTPTAEVAQFEHQLVFEYDEGATAFLQLVEVTGP